RLITTAAPSGPGSVRPSDEIIHTLCLASNATTGSVVRLKRSLEVGARPGSTSEVNVAPPSVDVANAVLDAPPSKKRPTWEVTTSVEPNANVSGSTAVACWLVGLENGSGMTAVFAAIADAGETREAATASATARTSVFMARDSTPDGVPRGASWRPGGLGCSLGRGSGAGI